jgi:exonuclease VII large subunit
MRTRKLKGRGRLVSKLSEEGKTKWDYVKDRITTERKAKIDAERERVSAAADQLREQAAATRERISARLKQAIQLLSLLPKDMKGYQADRLREEARAEREKLRTDLKSTIASSREKFKKTSEDLKAQYEGIMDREYAAILKEYSKPSKRKKKSSSSSTGGKSTTPSATAKKLTADEINAIIKAKKK